MSEESKKPYSLAYIKLFIEDIELMEASLTPEVAAILLFAIGNYAKDGTTREVPNEIKFAFMDFKRKIDVYRKSYQKISEQNAIKGAKGGRAKAANAKSGDNAKAPAKFKPPTKQEFKNAVYKLVEDNDFERVDQADIEEFYDELKESGWKIGNKCVCQEKM